MQDLSRHRSQLLSTTAITRIVSVAVVAGAMALPAGPTFAQCAPLTAGADNVACAGALDGTLSDALAGNDTITINTDVGVNAGATVSGGADNDSIALSSASYLGNFVGGMGQVLGDAGEDTITLDNTNVGESGDGTVSGGADNDSIALRNISRIGLNVGSTGVVLGDAGADTIMLDATVVGEFGSGTVSGGADNDSIALSNGSNIGNFGGSTGMVLGDAGADTITLDAIFVGSSGAGTVDGGDGADSIAVSNGSYIGRYNGGDGLVRGNDGTDFIAIDRIILGLYAGSMGQVLGDAGADTITVSSSYIGIFGDATFSGGADNDSIALTMLSRVGFNAGSTGQILGDAGADTITLDYSYVGGFGDGTVSGGAGNDSITLDNGSAIGIAAGGTGQVLGDGGDDTISIVGSIIGGAGMATVDGGADNDSITLGDGTTLGATGQVLGGTGDDTVAIFEGFTQNAGGLIDGGAGTGDFLELNRVTDLALAPGGIATIVTVVNFEGLAKSGPATLTLNGNHTFTAGVQVLAGTLVNTGALTAATTSVSPGAVLQTSGGSFVGNVANSGTFSPGGDGTVETVAISGNFTQNPGGTLNIDVVPTNGTADRLNVGGTATLGGTLAVTSLGAIAPTNEYVIIDAAGGVIGTFGTIAQSVAITQTVVIDGTTVVLRQVVDFTPGSIGTPNQIATGDNLNLVLAGGTNGNLFAALQALAGITDPAQFQSALDQQHSEPYLAQYLSTWFSSNDFATTMMSCPVSNGAMSVGVEGQCIWAKTSVRKFDQDRTTNNIGIEEKAASIAGGVQFALANSVHLGFGARYERVNADIDTRAQTDGDRFNFGAALKVGWGDTTLATVIEGGFGNYDTTRFIRLPGLVLNAEGEQDVRHVTTQARLAHSFKTQAMYVRPMIDLSATYISLGSINETGAGNLGLNVGSSDEWIFAATPAVEFGSEFVIADGNAIVRPFIRAGVTLLSEDNISVSTSFLGAPAGVSPFTISTEFDDVFAVLDAGIDVIGNDGMTLKINYGGQYGEDIRVHSGGAKLGFKF